MCAWRAACCGAPRTWEKALVAVAVAAGAAVVLAGEKKLVVVVVGAGDVTGFGGCDENEKAEGAGDAAAVGVPKRDGVDGVDGAVNAGVDPPFPLLNVLTVLGPQVTILCMVHLVIISLRGGGCYLTLLGDRCI